MEEQHPTILVNKDPAFISNIVYFVTELLANYGWYILFGGIFSFYILNKLYNSIYVQYRRKQDEDEYAAKYHKNPDLYQARARAMEEARRKMQEKLDQDADEYKMKQKEREEKKKQEFLEKHGSTTGGQKLGRGSQAEMEDKKSFKKEYNPLSSDGAGSSYRAPKRSCCSNGGGCG